jgi:hypothetical protein
VLLLYRLIGVDRIAKHDGWQGQNVSGLKAPSLRTQKNAAPTWQ